jgi:hypothetical protein
MCALYAHPAEAHSAAEALGRRAEIINVLPTYISRYRTVWYLVPQDNIGQQKSAHKILTLQRRTLLLRRLVGVPCGSRKSRSVRLVS